MTGRAKARHDLPPRGRHPGPQRASGPSGPEEVRRAVLDAAAELFADHGVDAVSLRDIAARADVQPSLIGRYVGTRDDLVDAVMADLSEQVAREVAVRRLEQHDFDSGSALGRWTVLLVHFSLTGRDLAPVQPANPALALAAVAREELGLDDRSARVRGAQILASALGWRIFERYLVEAAGLGDVPLQQLRDELTAAHVRLGGTPLDSRSGAGTDPAPDPEGDAGRG